MAGPLAIGARVRVLPPWSGDEDASSEPTTIAEVQFVTLDGEITAEVQADWQYLLDGDEPFANMAFRPEYLEPA